MKAQDIFFIESVILILVYLTITWKEKKFNPTTWTTEEIEISGVAFLLSNALLFLYILTQIK
jgi:hypothetical protein